MQPDAVPTSIPIPNPPRVDEDTVFNKFADFVTGYPRLCATLVIMLVLTIMWKRPLWRGILIGALLLMMVIFAVTN